MIQVLFKQMVKRVVPAFFREACKSAAPQSPMPEKSADGSSFPMVDQYGNVIFQTLPGFVHRSGEKPAMVCHTGAIKYYEDGVPHRDGDKPAILWQDGVLDFYGRGVFIKTERPKRSLHL